MRFHRFVPRSLVASARRARPVACLSAVLVAASASLAAPRPAAAAYAATVLYPLNPPAGTSGVGFNGPLHTFAGGQAAGNASGSDGSHAVVWTSAGTPVDLSQAGASPSQAYATSGSRQVGYADVSTQVHAFLWSGTAGSAVDLNPAGFNQSTAYGVSPSGAQQVGSGIAPGTGNNPAALLWNGTASSALDLNPAGSPNSRAVATNGSRQVGYAQLSNSSNLHAFLWSGTAAGAVDLNPAGFTSSNAYGVSPSGAQQVGYGSAPGTGNRDAALVWNGTASSALDLNPTNLTGFTSSYAIDTNGTNQVGYGSGPNGFRALLWSGTPDSAVDLGALLPSQYTSSLASTIDAAGNVFGYAASGSPSTYYAVEWTTAPAPEPASASLLAVGGAALLLRRRRRGARRAAGTRAPRRVG